jgi:deoxyribodipyrimidine photolyase-like uncharacterized protein
MDGSDPPRRWHARHFVGHRLATFGPYQDAMLAGDHR